MGVGRLSELLGGTASPVRKILITGASGWVGRETIALLQPILGKDFSNRVKLAGSRDSTITVNAQTHEIRSLWDIGSDERFDLVIHLAFLTQDRAAWLGDAEFTRRNREMSSFVFQICKNSGSKYVLVASSGAADPQVLAGYKSESKKLYGQLKREEEELFAGLPGALVEICRIWSISGSQMISPGKYALGDLISQAKNTGQIIVGTPNLVLRTYLDAGEMMSVLLIHLLQGSAGLVNSGGFETSIQNLAKIVLAELVPQGSLLVSEDFTADDIYVPEVLRFNTLAKDFGVSLSSLEEQVRTTARGPAFR